jgi:hypothetical protein
MFSAREDHNARLALIRLLMKYFRRRGIAWLESAVIHPTATGLLFKLGFRKIPAKRSRYYVHAKGGLSKDILDDWFCSGLDGDYFDLKDPLIS